MDGYERNTADELVVRWGDDDGGVGRLTVRAAAGGFSGIGQAWTGRTATLDFADRLGAYPLSEPVAISGGFAGDDPQEHVGIVVLQVGSRGQVGVQVHLATQIWPDTRPGSNCEVRLELLTTYQRLGTFSSDLRRVVEGSLAEAILGGELLA